MKRYLLRTSTLGSFVHVLILLSLVVSGCGPAATDVPGPAATEPPATEPQATEPPATGEPATEAPTDPAGEDIVLTFLYPGTPDSPEGAFISAAVNDFQAQSGIGVDLQFIPGSDYLTALVTRLEAGDPPDLSKLQYFDMFQFYKQGSLLSVEQAEGIIDDDFSADARDSTLFEGQHYGLPQRRDSCALAYEYLSMYQGSDHPNQAFQLMDFLTQSTQQEQAYGDLSWYPTRASVFQGLSLSCPPIGLQGDAETAIRLPVDVLQEVFDSVPERSSEVEPYLEGGVVLTREASGVFENEMLVGFGAPVWSSISPEDAKERMAPGGEGLVIGVLFINDVPEYPPGNYVVKCFTDSCVLIDEEGNDQDFDLLVSEEFDMPLELPRVSVEPGSELKCYWILFWKRCTKVG